MALRYQILFQYKKIASNFYCKNSNECLVKKYLTFDLILNVQIIREYPTSIHLRKYALNRINYKVIQIISLILDIK